MRARMKDAALLAVAACSDSSKTWAAVAKAVIISPFQAVSALSSSPGRTRRERAANSFWRHPAQGFLDDVAVEWVLGGLVRLQIGDGQEGVVVEHLLEVGHQPALVGAVAGEASPQVVVDAAHRHAVQGVRGHVPAVLVAE